MAPLVSATTGDTSPCRFLRRMAGTAPGQTRWVRSTSFATWSRRSTAPGSRSSSTSSTTTPPRAMKKANDTYYILSEDKSRYADYTGCGNTLNANEPIVRRLIIDSLRYWVSEMHVDG